MVRGRHTPFLAIGVPLAEQSLWSRYAAIGQYISIYAISLSSDGDLLLAPCAGHGTSQTPTFVALISIRTANARSLAALQANPRLSSFFANLEVFDLQDSDDYVDILTSIIAALSAFISPLVTLTVEQALALSTIRKDHELQSSKFSALESYIQQAGVKLVRERLFIAPDRTKSGDAVFQNVLDKELRQLLPVASKGLSAIDLLVKFHNHETTETLGIELYIGDNKQPTAAWRISPSSTANHDGSWVTLGLPHALDGIARDAELRLRVEEARGGVSVGMANFIANERYALRGPKGTTSARRPIAMRLWQAPPGISTRIPLVPTLAEPPNSSTATSYRVSANELAKVEPAKTSADGETLVLPSFVQERDAISLTGINGMLAAAVLRNVVPVDAISVSARVYVDPPTDNGIDVALIVADPDGDVPDSPNFSFPPPHSTSWSDWRTVASREPYQVSVLLTPESSNELPGRKLILLARLRDRDSSWPALLEFREIEIER